METENRIERTIGLVMLAVLAVGCVLVLRPFFTAVCFAAILVVASWPAFEGLARLFGGRRTLAACLMIMLATLVFVVPPAVVASRMDYNLAGTVRVLRDLSEHGPPPPPAWVSEVKVIGPALHDRWQALANRGPETAERVQALIAWARLRLIGAGLSLGNAIVQLIFAMLTAFFLYRDGVAVRRSLIMAGRRIAGDDAPRLLRVAYATIIGVVYGVLGTALAQALLLLVGLWITGIPAALLLGLILFLLSLIPFGPLLDPGAGGDLALCQRRGRLGGLHHRLGHRCGLRHRQRAEAMDDQPRQRSAADPHPIRRDQGAPSRSAAWACSSARPCWRSATS